MKTKVITDNDSEIIKVSWDGERFAITHILKDVSEPPWVSTAILNPKEMRDLVEFVCTLGGE